MLSLLSVVCPIRDAMQSRADHLSDSVNTATALVGLGVALELIEPIHDLVTWAKFKKREFVHRKELADVLPVSALAAKPKYRGEDHPKWVEWAGRIGLILVVVGVVGEWKYGAKLEDAHNALHALDLVQLTAAQIEAGDAADSAASAKASEEALEKKADALDIRLEGASRKLTGIEEQVRVQGPRWRLLEAHKKEFVDALKPFAQRFTILECGQKPTVEEDRLGQDLLSFMGKVNGAGWTPGVPGMGQWPKVAGITHWAECANGAFWYGGNLITFSAEADKTVQHSAQALADVLNEIEISTVIAPTSPGWMPQLIVYLGGDSPQALAVKDPTAVIFLVGANPMFDIAGENKRHKNAANH